jgi:outer membrane protein, adhesin transport system
MKDERTPMMFRITVLAMAAMLSTTSTTAQTDPALRDAAQRALDTNPEITGRMNALRAGDDGIDIARSGLLPKVAIQGGAGRTQDTISSRNPESGRLDETAVALTANQLLWDGLTTSRNVDRARRERGVNWYELVDATERVTLEAARAHFDVQRFRRLVEFAEDNYVQHRYVQGQVASRVQAGVSRGVDLEQSGARLALTEANLTSETANLHDVMTRYLRIVGTVPAPGTRHTPLVADGLPAQASEAVTIALRNSSATNKVGETLRAARAAASASEGAFQPRIEARLSSGTGHNYDGVVDQQRDTKAEIVFNWNLYNGGGDAARVRQGANLLNRAADQRDQVCRDARQVTSIAFSDIRKLSEQLPALERNTLASEKTRDAYRQQFDIGQRSLLDLLNSENELYTARRSLLNAQIDLSIAHARLLAATQRLGKQLGLNVVLPPAPPAEAEGAPDDRPARCPVEVAELLTTPRSELDARATRLIQAAPPLVRPAAPPR